MPDPANERPTEPSHLDDALAATQRLLTALPEFPEAEGLRTAVGALAAAVRDFQQYSASTSAEGLALSRGELKTRIQSRGRVANALRSVQSTLRHLSYQAGAVADGDLSIEIYGLGPLGEAFNRMAQRLRENRDAIEAKNAQLADRNRQLHQAYEVIDQQFRVVGDIQVSLLPEQTPAIPGFDVATHYRPATRAGGDYFDFFPLPGDRWGVIVADVSGHGAPAAVVMAMTRVIMHIMEQTRRSDKGPAHADAGPPERVLGRLNQALCDNILSGMFVTCCYGVLDAGARSFRFASAGHPPPILYRARDGAADPVTAEGSFPLGIVPEADYQAAVIHLLPGDALIIYTDGITEAFDPQRNQFGEDRLLVAVRDAAADGAETLRRTVLAALDDHRGPVELADDTTLVVFRTLDVSPD